MEWRGSSGKIQGKASVLEEEYKLKPKNTDRQFLSACVM
jgi:hypothetical protein